MQYTLSLFIPQPFNDWKWNHYCIKVVFFVGNSHWIQSFFKVCNSKLKTVSALTVSDVFVTLLFLWMHTKHKKQYWCFFPTGSCKNIHRCLLLSTHLTNLFHLIYGDGLQVLFYEDRLKRFTYAVHHGLLTSKLLYLPGCVKWPDSGLGHQIYSLQSFDLRNQWLVLLNQVVYFFGILLSSLVLWSSQFFVLSSLRSKIKCYFFSSIASKHKDPWFKHS